MRAFNQGAFIRVTVSVDEVAAFKRTWPCSGMPTRAVSFTFQTSNGDLVDLYPNSLDGEDVLALSHDASNYAAKRLNMPQLAR